MKDAYWFRKAVETVADHFLRYEHAVKTQGCPQANISRTNAGGKGENIYIYSDDFCKAYLNEPTGTQCIAQFTEGVRHYCNRSDQGIDCSLMRQQAFRWTKKVPKGAWEDRKAVRSIEENGETILFYKAEHVSAFDDNGPDHPCSRKFRINYLTGGSVPEEHLTHTPINPYDYYYQKHLP